MGIGLTIVQSTGDFDFAIGAEATVGACAIAKIMVELIPNFYIAFLLTMIVVACIGLFNSYIVINIGMQAFVGLQGFLSWDRDLYWESSRFQLYC